MDYIQSTGFGLKDATPSPEPTTTVTLAPETVDLTKPIRLVADQIELLQRYKPPGYKPTRLEYFSATILSAMLVGRSTKDQQKCVARSLKFAKDMLEALDG